MSTDVQARPAYRDANALRWVGGYLSSLIGDQVWFVALGWAAVQAGTPGQVGLVIAAGAVPRALLLVFGGALADRWGPRRAAIRSDAARTVLLLGAASAALLTPPSVAVLFLLAAAFGAVDALFLPAAGAMPQQLVLPEQITSVQGMRATAQRVATTAGAPLGGLAVAIAGIGWAFALAAFLTAVSVVALFMTRVRSDRPSHDEPLLREVRAGLRYVRHHHVLLPLLVFSAAAELGFSGAVNVGLPILAADRGWGAGGVGLLLGAFGLGATATALLLVAKPHVPRAGLMLAPIVALMATSLAGIGMSPSLRISAIAAFCLGAGAGLAGSLVGSLVLTESDPALVSRVVSLATLASLGLSPVALGVTGLLAEAAGASAPFMIGGLISALGACVVVASPGLRRAELP